MSTRMVLGLVCSLVVMLQGSVDYPAKPVRISEPFGAGGGPDIIARAISLKLTALWAKKGYDASRMDTNHPQCSLSKGGSRHMTSRFCRRR
jgi:hypothetical protein